MPLDSPFLGLDLLSIYRECGTRSDLASERSVQAWKPFPVLGPGWWRPQGPKFALGGIFGGLDAFGFPVSRLGPPVNISGMRYSKRSGVRKVRASLETVPRAWARLVAPSGSTIGIGGDFWWPGCLWIPHFSAWTSCPYIGNAVLEAIWRQKGPCKPGNRSPCLGQAGGALRVQNSHWGGFLVAWMPLDSPFLGLDLLSIYRECGTRSDPAARSPQSSSVESAPQRWPSWRPQD